MALRDKSEDIRILAAEALRNAALSPKVISALIEALSSDESEKVRIRAIVALSEVANRPEVFRFLLAALKDKEEAVRTRAADALLNTNLPSESTSLLLQMVLELSAVGEKDRGTVNIHNLPTKVILNLDHDFVDFDSAKQHSFITILAYVLSIDLQQIRIIGVDGGSVIITLEMPEDRANALLAMYLKRDPLLSLLRIASVRLQTTEIGRFNLGTPFESKVSGLSHNVKILFLTSNPSDQAKLQLEQEVRAIDNALAQAKFSGTFELAYHPAVRVTDLQNYILRHKPDIVHFSGHGSQSNEILLEDDYGNSHPVAPRALAKLFSILRGNIQCVVLNACYSKHQAEGIAESINCVIGMSNAITDVAAISFSTAFYRAIGFGENMKTAFDLGCVQLDLENLDEQDVPKLLSLKGKPEEIVLCRDA